MGKRRPGHIHASGLRKKPTRGTDVISASAMKPMPRSFVELAIRDVVKRYSDFIEHPIVLDVERRKTARKPPKSRRSIPGRRSEASSRAARSACATPFGSSGSMLWLERSSTFHPRFPRRQSTRRTARPPVFGDRAACAASALSACPRRSRVGALRVPAARGHGLGSRMTGQSFQSRSSA